MFRPVRIVAALLVLVAAALLALTGAHVWAWSHARAAERDLAAGRYPAAYGHIQKALKIWPGRRSTNLRAARIARMNNDLDATAAFLQKCHKLQGGETPESQLEWVLLRAQSGEIDQVSQALWQAVKDDHPDAVHVLECLARVYIREVRLQAALACLDEWLARDPDNVRALDWRAWVHEKRFDQEDTVADYKRVVELAPDRSDLRLRYADVLVSYALLPEALPHLERLHREQPDNLNLLGSLATCRFLLGQTDEARALFDQLLAARPDDLVGLIHRAKLRLQSGDPTGAEADIRRAIATDPYNADSFYTLSMCLAKQPGKEQEAAEATARTEQLKTDTRKLDELLKFRVDQSRGPDVPYEVGVLFLKLGNEPLGVQWLNQALRRDPTHAGAHQRLAEYYEKAGDAKQAAEHRAALRAIQTKEKG